MAETPISDFRRLYKSVVRYLTLQLDYAMLTGTEKLAIILSVIAFYALVVILAMIALLFISFGVGHMLAVTIAPHAAYLIVGAFYVLLIVLLAIFRKQLIFNPAARFLSRLLLKDPDKQS